MSLCRSCSRYLNGCPIETNDPVTDCVEYRAKGGSVNKGPLEDEIRTECAALAEFLCAKNRAYGSSVSQPIGIFAKRADPLLAMDVRIDDKLNRLARGGEFPGDDTVQDLIGYLLIRRIVARKQGTEGMK